MVSEGLDRYNSWTNRETWALYTHITSDESLYNEVRANLVDADNPAEALKALVDSRCADVTEAFHDMVPGSLWYLWINALLDAGSLWRVNWQEIAKALLE